MRLLYGRDVGGSIILNIGHLGLVREKVQIELDFFFYNNLSNIGLPF